MAVAGLLLRLNSTFIRFLEFLAAALCLGIFSYFLADLSRHHLDIPTYAKAVEGIAGAAVIYTAFAVILTFFLGGIIFFAFLAIVLDLLFMGGFIAIAVLTRRSDSCRGSTVRSVMGAGAPGTHAVGVGNLGRACKLEEAVFGAAIGAAILFLISAVLQLLLGKHHQKEKRYGPGPSNNYGKDKRRPWARKPKATHDAELGAVGATAAVAEKETHDRHHARDHTRDNTVRPSGDTAITGSTMAATGDAYGGPVNKYANNDRHLHTHGDNDRHLHNHGVLGTHEPAAVATHVPEPEAPRHGDGFPHLEPPTATAAAALGGHHHGGHNHGYTAGTNY